MESGPLVPEISRLLPKSANAEPPGPFKRIAVTIGNQQTAAPHGLSYAPPSVSIAMTSNGTIWKSASSDATNVYLRADGPNRTAEVLVG